MNNLSRVSGLSPNVQGIFWMLTAGLFFSLMVALVKLLGSHFPSVEIVLFRKGLQCIHVTGSAAHMNRDDRPRVTADLPLYISRI